MKKLLLISALILGSTIIAQANTKPDLSADLRNQFIDAEQFNYQTIRGGQVYVSEQNKTITLYVQPVLNCDPDKICPAYMPPAIKIELPLVSVEETTYCGGRVYTAQQDLRPVDGSLQVIIVSDDTRFYDSCVGLLPVPPVSVSYQRKGYSLLNRSEYNYVSTFVGETIIEIPASKL